MNSLDLSSYFQAGTLNIAGGVALTTAIDYLMNLGMENIHKHEKEIVNYAIN
ncbi:MAG: aminotransferase class V-fold PLP-dependent enzyme, partial [Candidatus Methanomethylicia archaeon]